MYTSFKSVLANIAFFSFNFAAESLRGREPINKYINNKLLKLWN